jgi:hypothetical protein
MTTPPSYLTDHGDAVEEIGTLAHLPARLVHLTNAEGAPLTHLELTVLAAQAAQRTSVHSAPQPAPTGIRVAALRPTAAGQALSRPACRPLDRAGRRLRASGSVVEPHGRQTQASTVGAAPRRAGGRTHEAGAPAHADRL